VTLLYVLGILALACSPLIYIAIIVRRKKP
jgi:hypothetical protein